MKVWKPAFWVFDDDSGAAGSSSSSSSSANGNTLLIFRERAHYLDFKSNPFLTAAERSYTVKKRVALGPAFRCLPINRKGYRSASSSPQLYYFALEQVYDFGPLVVVKFGSESQSVLEDLRQLLTERIQALKAAAASASPSS